MPFISTSSGMVISRSTSSALWPGHCEMTCTRGGDRSGYASIGRRWNEMTPQIAIAIWGVISFQRLPIDAYPDLSPPRVQVISQWPGHNAEDVERLITIPLEVEMNGIPNLDALRSISLYGLSSITMNFDFGTDPYFAREQAFERVPQATVPDGVT